MIDGVGMTYRLYQFVHCHAATASSSSAASTAAATVIGCGFNRSPWFTVIWGMNTHNLGALALALASIDNRLGALPAPAQSPATNAPAFEAASVKPNKSTEPGSSFGVRPGGQLVVTRNTLRNMIRNTYRLQDFQIVGGADRFNSDRFDIVAKALDNASPDQMLLMMRTLLADRFKLVVHNETREMPVYALVMGRSDGKPGPQLRPATVDCAAMLAAARQPGAAPPPSPPAGDRPLCGMRTGPGRMMAGGYALADVARNLSSFTGRIVLDKTGLIGTFDLDLTWTPIISRRGRSRLAHRPIDPNGPSIFTAMQEQLGLKLDSQKGPVESWLSTGGAADGGLRGRAPAPLKKMMTNVRKRVLLRRNKSATGIDQSGRAGSASARWVRP